MGGAIHGQVVLAYIRKHTEQTRENKSMVIFSPVLPSVTDCELEQIVDVVTWAESRSPRRQTPGCACVSF